MGCAKAAARVDCAARRRCNPIGGDPANSTYQVSGFVQLAQLTQGTA
jgi:hypothetical protein